MAADEQATASAESRPYQARTWSTGLYKLAAFGKATEAAVKRLVAADPAFDRLSKLEDSELLRLADALSDWRDESVAQLLGNLADELAASGQDVEIAALCNWCGEHPNEPEAVLDCVHVRPPAGVELLRRLSKAGSQKRVYLARWEQAPDRPVVLKRLLGSLPEQLALLARELQSHPLAARHPHIIATHVLYSGPEPFLVEERLHEVLHDGWRAGGTVEAANLLHDVALALAYIHEVRGWVHGDIKPDNIGRKEGAYILLDFGICRPVKAFTRETTATGSLRTRAPELFETDRYDAPQKADVWALAATVYRAVTGRFLFIDDGESVPKITERVAREDFEKVILRRIETEWGRRVVFQDIPEPLRGVLRRALVRSPDDRLTAKELVRLCEQKLAAFLRSPVTVGPAPEEELEQLLRHLPADGALRLMPAATRQNLVHRLREAQGQPNLPPEQGVRIAAVLKLLE